MMQWMSGHEIAVVHMQEAYAPIRTRLSLPVFASVKV